MQFGSAKRRDVVRRGCGIALCGLFGGCLERTQTSEQTTSTPSKNNDSSATTTAGSTPTKSTATTTTDSILEVGDTATVNQGDVTLQNATATLVVKAKGNHVDLLGNAGSQYLVAALRVSFGSPVNCVLNDPPVALFLDDTRYDVALACLYENAHDPNQGPIAFEVPRDIDFEAARIAWLSKDGKPAASWRLPDVVSDRLRNPPAFAVRSFEIPEVGETGSSVEASFEVENEGDGPGEFVYQFDTGRTTRPDLGNVSLDVWERVTRKEVVEVYGEPGTQITVELDWGLGSDSRTLDVEDGD